MFQSSICNFMQFFCCIGTDIRPDFIFWSTWTLSCSVVINKRIWILLSFFSLKFEIHLCVILTLFLVSAFTCLNWYLFGSCPSLILLPSTNLSKFVECFWLFRIQLFNVEEHIFELSLGDVRMSLRLSFAWMPNWIFISMSSTISIQNLVQRLTFLSISAV